MGRICCFIFVRKSCGDVGVGVSLSLSQLSDPSRLLASSVCAFSCVAYCRVCMFWHLGLLLVNVHSHTRPTVTLLSSLSGLSPGQTSTSRPQGPIPFHSALAPSLPTCAFPLQAPRPHHTHRHTQIHGLLASEYRHASDTTPPTLTLRAGRGSPPAGGSTGSRRRCGTAPSRWPRRRRRCCCGWGRCRQSRPRTQGASRRRRCATHRTGR